MNIADLLLYIDMKKLAELLGLYGITTFVYIAELLDIYMKELAELLGIHGFYALVYIVELLLCKFTFRKHHNFWSYMVVLPM